jgi:hypothetical protein
MIAHDVWYTYVSNAGNGGALDNGCSFWVGALRPYNLTEPSTNVRIIISSFAFSRRALGINQEFSMGIRECLFLFALGILAAGSYARPFSHSHGNGNSPAVLSGSLLKIFRL